MRASGKTTRRIDKLIQLLFNNIDKRVIIIDCKTDAEDYEITADIMIKKIKLRLRNEHDITTAKRLNNYNYRLVHTLTYISKDLVGIDEPMIESDFKELSKREGVLYRTLTLLKL